MLGLWRTINGMVGFYRQRRLVLEDHFSPAFQYDQDFFVLMSAVFSD